MPGVGARRFLTLLRTFGTPASATQYWTQELGRCRSKLSRQEQGKNSSHGLIDRIPEFLKKQGQITYWGQFSYPAPLLALSEPPPIIFSLGNLLLGKTLAVVGTRKPTLSAENFCRSMCEKIVSEQITIISGGARGVDAIAHQTALDALGNTVAVLGCGLSVVYPAEHSHLFENIQKNGALISELLPDAPPRSCFFPTRNRIIAALGDATIVVQAPAKSGALQTAAIARKLRKPVFAVFPLEANAPAWAGNEYLLDTGATPIYADRLDSFIVDLRRL